MPDGAAPPARRLGSAAILQLHAIVHSGKTFAEAATALAAELARLQGAERVCIGFVEAGYAEVVAVSGETDFKAGADIFRAVGAAMDEAIEQGATVAHPGRPGERPRVNLAHAELSRRNGTTACSVPLVSRGRAIGAITLEHKAGEVVETCRVGDCEGAACMLAPTLDLRRQAELGWYRRLIQGGRALRENLGRPGHAAAGVAIVLVVFGLAALAALPVDYRVSAPARLEGSIQRALVAPADGFLRNVHVKPGDAVAADQVLAELADQDLAIESRKWASELAQHDNSSRAALARGERTQYVVFAGKAAEARAQLDLVEQQLTRGRIRAPFDGVLIKGDLSQMLGAPVARGDVLLTVAPARQFRLIVEVDERDIADVRAGAAGEVALAALPGETVRFRIVRVTPVATSKEGRNYYEVEGHLAEVPATLRPGLQGVAKISAERRSFAWIWGHRLVDWARLTLWTFGA